MDNPLFIVIIIILTLGIIALVVYLLKGSSTSSRIDNAVKLIKIKDYSKSIEILKTLIAKDDSNSEAHFYLAESYYLSDNYEWALPEYKKVLRLNKYTKNISETMTRLRLAEIFLHIQQLEEAQKEFLLIVQIDPENYKSYSEIGRIYIEKERYEQAAHFLKKALEINPNHIDSLFYSGIAKYHLKLNSEALHDLEKCINLDKYYYKANFYIGMVNFQVKNYQKALQQFDIASREKEYRLRSLYQKGIILNELGNLAQAIVEFDKAVALIKEEDNIARNIRYYLANAYEQEKNIAAAIEQWEKIIASQPNFRDVNEKLANYSDLRMEDTLKDFFVASNPAFEELCRKVLMKLGLEVVEVVSVGSVLAVFIVLEKLGINDIRVQKLLVRVYRQNEPLGDRIVREIAEQLKQESGLHKAICISATGFSNQAIDFAEARPINLISGKDLSKLLR